MQRNTSKLRSASSNDNTQDPMQELKNFQMAVEEKFLKLEKAIVINSSFGMKSWNPTNFLVLHGF